MEETRTEGAPKLTMRKFRIGTAPKAIEPYDHDAAYERWLATRDVPCSCRAPVPGPRYFGASRCIRCALPIRRAS